MLNVFYVLKFIRVKLTSGFSHLVTKQRRQSRSPYFIGFFLGFIVGCGSLQVMYILAAGNGGSLEGAKILSIFGLGTLPALLGFGLIASML